jgi:hypothetical protein
MIRVYPIIVFIFFSCSEKSKETKTNSTSNSDSTQRAEAINKLPSHTRVDTNNTMNRIDFSVQSIKLENGWGYQIFQGKKLMINQKNIPAVQGNQVFLTEKEALKVGELVLNKLLQNQFPPTVTTEELTTLGIEFQK